MNKQIIPYNAHDNTLVTRQSSHANHVKKPAPTFTLSWIDYAKIFVWIILTVNLAGNHTEEFNNQVETTNIEIIFKWDEMGRKSDDEIGWGDEKTKD